MIIRGRIGNCTTVLAAVKQFGVRSLLIRGRGLLISGRGWGRGRGRREGFPDEGAM